MASTIKGRELANRLVRYYLPHPTPAEVDYSELDEVCSLLLRHGTTYNRLQERMASDSSLADERRMAKVEHQAELKERRMGELLKRLPAPDAGYRWQLRFDGLYAALECVEQHEDARHSASRSIPLSNY